MSGASYDGWAGWYEEYLKSPGYEAVSDTLMRLLGRGSGRCLDYGCGVGHYFAGVAQLGWTVVGLDVSSDMLARARSRSPLLVRGDANELPFPDNSLDAVMTCLTHTDVDDVAPVFAEVRRVLRTGGRYVTVAVHPCFAGPTARWSPEGRVTIDPGYFETRRRFVGRGVRARVGVRHVPLSELLTKLARSGLQLVEVVESGPLSTPIWLGLAAART